jgi:hypothetical protein
MPALELAPMVPRTMLHWSHKLPAVVVFALTVAAVFGKGDPFGFFW